MESLLVYGINLSKSIPTDSGKVGIVFFGTPHDGSNAAVWASIFLGIYNLVRMQQSTTAMQELQPDGQNLYELSVHFSEVARQQRFPMVNFLETKNEPGLLNLVCFIRDPF